jgi:hypothetical protein
MYQGPGWGEEFFPFYFLAGLAFVSATLIATERPQRVKSFALKLLGNPYKYVCIDANKNNSTLFSPLFPPGYALQDPPVPPSLAWQLW